MVAPVPAPDARFISSSARRDLQVICKNKLRWRVSHDRRELEKHLGNDYYSYTRFRHGDDAFVQPRRVVRRAFGRGGLLIVENAAGPLAGLVFEKRGRTLQMWTLACAESNGAHLAKGALAGVYAFCFDLARSQSLEFVDMRGCRPSPADSLFFVKHKWGAQVREHGETAFEFLFDWKEANGAVRRFLEKTPLIFRDAGHLSVLGTAESEARIRWREAGLHRFVPLNPVGTVNCREAGSLSN
jgi:hypothetical protein